MSDFVQIFMTKKEENLPQLLSNNLQKNGIVVLDPLCFFFRLTETHYIIINFYILLYIRY